MSGLGAPKGAKQRLGKPNKATKELKEMILGALSDSGGQAYLQIQSIENPVAFMSLLGKILPKDINAKVDAGITITEIRHTIVDPGHQDSESI
jgi:hypothetical protein